jgi:hypothetical protein
MHFILKYPVSNLSTGVIYTAYSRLILYFNWNRLPTEALGTFTCKSKILRKRFGNVNKNV